MLTILLSAWLGVISGFGYALGRTLDSDRASIREVPINGNDPAARRARQYPVGHQRGLRIGDSIVMATISGIIGGIFGAIIWTMRD
jgi:hypothetical protein